MTTLHRDQVCWLNEKEETRAPYDVVRTAKNGLFGLLWLGPMNHIFWGKTVFGLEYWFPGPSWGAVFTRVLVDQCTNMPLNMVIFLAWPSLLAGRLDAAVANDDWRTASSPLPPSTR